MAADDPEWGPTSDAEDAARRRATKNIAKIAAGRGLTVRQVQAAFHPIKSANLGYVGPKLRNNPDVFVDPKTGWLFPQLTDGTLGECIGNLDEYIDL
jgi:hypothetical protein